MDFIYTKFIVLHELAQRAVFGLCGRVDTQQLDTKWTEKHWKLISAHGFLNPYRFKGIVWHVGAYRWRLWRDDTTFIS